MRRLSATAAALLAAILVLGCEAGDAPPADTPGTTGSPDHPGAAATAPAGDLAGRGGPAALAPINRSGITGTVETAESGDEVTLTVRVDGLEPSVTYPVRVYSGRCATGGAVAAPLGRLTGGSDGTARVTTRVARETVAGDSAFVQVHGSRGAAVACADLDALGGA